MSFEIKTATPDHQPIILGLTGPSGAGKTYSALLLAHGIKDIVGGEIGVVDTEGRRALRYADKTRYPDFNFKHMNLTPPFSSDRYGEAIAAMAKSGVKTIIVDSQSLEHEGPGGYLEFHEAELDRMAGDDWKKRQKMTFTAWIKPAAARRKLINSFLQVPLNFIFCFRAKEKLKVISGAEPIPLGWQAIAGDEFVYEMIVRMLLPPGSRGMPDWSQGAFQHGAAKRDDQDKSIFPDDMRISRVMGQNLAKAYSGNGPIQPRMGQISGETVSSQTNGQKVTPSQATGTASTSSVDDLQNEGMEAADGGTDVLKVWFTRLPHETKAMIKEFMDKTLKPRAAETDALAFNEQEEPGEAI